MHVSTKKMLSRIKDLLQHASGVIGNGRIDDAELDYITFGTISLISVLYGEDHDFINQINKERQLYINRMRDDYLGMYLKGTIVAMLETIRFAIKSGLIHSLEKKAKGEIIGDFLGLSKTLLEEGYKDAAAVLAAGALEDTMKKFALENRLEMDDKDLSTAINALKSKGLLKGNQAGLAHSYVPVRNKAFHAQFEKIEK